MSTPKRIVLVTGGNNGIGFAACQLFASQPNYHTVMASRSLDKGQKALASIKSSSSSGNISLVQLDITSDDSIAAAVKEIESQHGRLDVLINNAGICPTEFTRSAFRECLETNAISPAMVTKAFAPLLLKSSDARVVYVSSLLGSITNHLDPNAPSNKEDYRVYRVSKAALNMVVASDATEYEGKMKVFAYCPGYVITDLAGERERKEKMGFAKSPDGSARGLLAIADGRRDVDENKFLRGENAGEVYPW